MIRVIWLAMTPTASCCRSNWKSLSPVIGLPRSFKISSLTHSIAILPVKPGVESILLICGCNPSFTSDTGVFIILFYLILLFRNVWERQCCSTSSQSCLATAFSPGSRHNRFWNCFDGILFPMWLIWKTPCNSRNVLPFFVKALTREWQLPGAWGKCVKWWPGMCEWANLSRRPDMAGWRGWE